jgi:hypothetical protein
MVQTPLEKIDQLFAELVAERSRPDGVVDPNFNLFMTTHYSEILLYKDFEGLLGLARKYGLITYVLSNGVNMTPDKVDLISEYRDVVHHIGMNIPIFENAELWSKRAGFPAKRFDDLIANLEYLHNHQLSEHLGQNVAIHINGLDQISFDTGINQKGPEFDTLEMDLDPNTGEHARQYQIAKSKFPKFGINKNGLLDRTGHISHLITDQPMLKARMENRKVVGCGNWGDRTLDWLSLTATGEAILCCNDYNFEYSYGNIYDTSVREVWLGDKRVEQIKRAYGDICTRCVSSIVA